MRGSISDALAHQPLAASEVTRYPYGPAQAGGSTGHGAALASESRGRPLQRRPACLPAACEYAAELGLIVHPTIYAQQPRSLGAQAAQNRSRSGDVESRPHAHFIALRRSRRRVAAENGVTGEPQRSFRIAAALPSLPGACTPGQHGKQQVAGNGGIAGRNGPIVESTRQQTCHTTAHHQVALRGRAFAKTSLSPHASIGVSAPAKGLSASRTALMKMLSRSSVVPAEVSARIRASSSSSAARRRHSQIQLVAIREVVVRNAVRHSELTSDARHRNGVHAAAHHCAGSRIEDCGALQLHAGCTGVLPVAFTGRARFAGGGLFKDLFLR